MHGFTILALASSLALMAFAQARAGRSNPTDGIALPLAGAPLSLEAVGTVEELQDDGTTKIDINRALIYRDVDGRTRFDLSSPRDGQDEPLRVIRITDPVAGQQFLLFVQMRIAYHIVLPKADLARQPRFAFFGVGSELIRETGEKTHKNESLGKQTIEGVEFAGSRITTTVVADPSLVAIDENWISQELGLIGLVRSSGPRGKTTVTIQNLTHNEPDPTLFAVPPEYTVREFERPDSAK